MLLPLPVVLMAAVVDAETADRVDEFVRAEMARQKVPGVAVAVVDHGKVVKAAGYGYANVEHGGPVRPETVLQSGSLGKRFTAATVMTLVEEGRLALDDSIAKYFPEAPEVFRPITCSRTRRASPTTRKAPSTCGATTPRTRWPGWPSA